MNTAVAPTTQLLQHVDCIAAASAAHMPATVLVHAGHVYSNAAGLHERGQTPPPCFSPCEEGFPALTTAVLPCRSWQFLSPQSIGLWTCMCPPQGCSALLSYAAALKLWAAAVLPPSEQAGGGFLELRKLE
jgi:hypothetical protein